MQLMTRATDVPAAMGAWASAVLVTVMAFGTATGALGATGKPVVTADNPPAEIKPIRAAGLVCRTDTSNFRAWWGETPGAAGAVPGSDGSCATIPSIVPDTLAVAEAIRLASNAAGFPVIVGDRALVLRRDGAWYRRTVRARPKARAATLGRIAPATRGRLLAGLGATERTRVYRGLPSRLVTRLKRDVTRALSGRPRDYVGGDRRVDIMFDGTSATGLVNSTVVGRAPCTQSVAVSGRRTFVSGSFILFAPDAVVPRAVIAHELFHTVQCILGLPGGTPAVVAEGTAEWHAATFEPVDFAGAEIAQGNMVSVTGGAARAISFCNDFDPTSTTGLDGYRAFGVWSALEIAAPGTVLGVLTAGATTPFTTTQTVIGHIGDARWSEALLVATREICGNLRTPSGQTVFPPGIRAFFGANPGTPAAQPAAPATVTLAPGGVRTIPVGWPPTDPPPTTVTIQVAAPGIDPAAVAARTFVHVAGELVSAGPDATGSAAVLSGAQVTAQGGAVTVANPSSIIPLSITVSVTSTP